MEITKKNVIALLAIVMIIGTAGAAFASDITGTVEVITPKLTASNLVCPDSINPEASTQFSFDLSDVDDIARASMIQIGIFHSSKTPQVFDSEGSAAYAAASKEALYVANILNTGALDWSYPSSGQTVKNTVWMTGMPDIHLMTTTKQYTYQFNIKVQGVALEGTWTIMVDVVESGVHSTISDTFEVNSYMGLTVVESSFSFGQVQQGMYDIAVQVPSTGYLTANVISNFQSKLQVSATNPTSGANSFPASNIHIWDSNNPAAAQDLTGSLVDLNGASYLGTVTVHIYLWIDAPASALLGTYTFTLTVVLVAV